MKKKLVRRKMARRRAPSRARRVVRRARSIGGGGLKPVLDGAMAGALGEFATKYVGGWGHPAATLGVGYFRNNVTLKTEGARELGAMIVSQFGFGGGQAGGGLYEA